MMSSLRLAAWVSVSIFISSAAVGAAGDGSPQLPEHSGAILLDPVFLPTNLATTFHMTPILFRDGHVLRQGEFDFDMALGTAGTDFDETEKVIRLEEDSDWTVFTDFGFRFGLLDSLGPLPT